jgi:hypothetical protein
LGHQKLLSEKPMDRRETQEGNVPLTFYNRHHGRINHHEIQLQAELQAELPFLPSDT